MLYSLTVVVGSDCGDGGGSGGAVVVVVMVTLLLHVVAAVIVGAVSVGAGAVVFAVG